MNTKEVQIGNLVNVLGTPAKIISLDSNGYYKTEDLKYHSTNSMSSDYMEHSATPIELTEDILKANNFYYDNLCWQKQCRPYYISIFKDFTSVEVAKIDGWGTDDEETDVLSELELKHKLNVHELQIFLRLLGLDDVVDNFKIEEDESKGSNQ